MGGGVPRFLIESTYEVAHGSLIPDAVARETVDETPIAARWGGWYVSGQDGGWRTASGQHPPSRTRMLRLPSMQSRRGSLTSLASMLDTSPYLRNSSDIVALLVLEHQVTVHNLIIRANFKSRMLLTRLLPAADAAGLHWAQLPAALQTRLDALLAPVVDGLTLRKAPLPDKVVGVLLRGLKFQAQGLARRVVARCGNWIRTRACSAIR